MKKMLSLYLCTFFLSVVVHAEVPNQFSPGEIVSSSKVNANFAYLANMIGNDNVTAMMVCNASGVVNDKYYYALCYATDNQTFENNLRISHTFLYNDGSLKFQNEPLHFEHSINNGISLNDIFKSKWILFETKRIITSQNGTPRRYYENHIFFKINK